MNDLAADRALAETEIAPLQPRRRASTLVDSAAPTGATPMLVAVPANGVALLTYASAVANPLDRRHALGAARFLATTSFPDRITVPCRDANRVQGVTTCGSTSGTFGFYDSVRAVAYLGKGSGADPHLTASYDHLPTQITISSTVIGSGTLSLTADYTTCGRRITAGTTLDATTLPPECSAGPVTLTMTLAGAATGSQAEIYLTADAQAAANLAPTGLKAAPDLSVDEGLVMPAVAK